MDRLVEKYVFYFQKMLRKNLEGYLQNGAMAFGIMTFKRMPLCFMILRVMTFIKGTCDDDTKCNDTQYNDNSS